MKTSSICFWLGLMFWLIADGCGLFPVVTTILWSEGTDIPEKYVVVAMFIGALFIVAAVLSARAEKRKLKTS